MLRPTALSGHKRHFTKNDTEQLLKNVLRKKLPDYPSKDQPVLSTERSFTCYLLRGHVSRIQSSAGFTERKRPFSKTSASYLNPGSFLVPRVSICRFCLPSHSARGFPGRQLQEAPGLNVHSQNPKNSWERCNVKPGENWISPVLPKENEFVNTDDIYTVFLYGFYFLYNPNSSVCLFRIRRGCKNVYFHLQASDTGREAVSQFI